MNAQFNKAVEQAYQKFAAMSQEEFDSLLEKYEDHYIGKILEEAQALDIKIIEAECFNDSFETLVVDAPYYEQEPIIDRLVSSVCLSSQSFIPANNEYSLSSRMKVSMSILGDNKSEIYSTCDSGVLELAA